MFGSSVAIPYMCFYIDMNVFLNTFFVKLVYISWFGPEYFVACQRIASGHMGYGKYQTFPSRQGSISPIKYLQSDEIFEVGDLPVFIRIFFRIGINEECLNTIYKILPTFVCLQVTVRPRIIIKHFGVGNQKITLILSLKNNQHLQTNLKFFVVFPSTHNPINSRSLDVKIRPTFS